jgi:Arc/MetJ-type ribon-helix-helix transcriptional regulator
MLTATASRSAWMTFSLPGQTETFRDALRAPFFPVCLSGCNALHLEMRPGYYTGMATTTIGFAVADEDRDRLDRLVEHFGAGNRSAFLRAALPVMEALARADRLRELQARNAERAAAAGLDRDALLAAIQASYKTGRDSR